MLDYLGRYTHRVAISNERILDIGADTVSVRVRDWTQGNRRRTLKLPAQTFIERHEYLRCTHCGRGQFVPTAPIAPVPLRLLHLRGPP